MHLLERSDKGKKSRCVCGSVIHVLPNDVMGDSCYFCWKNPKRILRY
jgi:hypothetical protein